MAYVLVSSKGGATPEVDDVNKRARKIVVVNHAKLLVILAADILEIHLEGDYADLVREE